MRVSEIKDEDRAEILADIIETIEDFRGMTDKEFEGWAPASVLVRFMSIFTDKGYELEDKD